MVYRNYRYTGFPLDAVKHIDSFFIVTLFEIFCKEYGDDFYVFGEFWNNDEAANMTT